MEKELLELKQKPLWQMTGEEFLRMLELAMTSMQGVSADILKDDESVTAEKARNLTELATKLGCGYTTISELKKKGVLDKAVSVTFGNRNVYDVSVARKLVKNYYCDKKSTASPVR